ncbi:MAG: DUF2029 domain-containing protein [Alphaproteobacteria bacterium]|nr:DUF2029 domain-containing protein [Alphaproteobacteria bacterium]
MRSLRTGAWLTAERIRVYSWILIVLWTLGLAGVVATSSDYRDAFGRPLGTDFANVWTAGAMALDGHAAAVWEPEAHHAVQLRVFGPGSPFYGWHYPPFFLLVASVLALMPYGLALGVWLAGTVPLYLRALKGIVSDRLATLAAVAFPGVAVTAIHGQNGFLTTALFAGALMQLERRPYVSGVLFGLMAYKPQFGLLVPVALAVSGRWRAFGAASLTVAMLAGISTLAFGMEIWDAFLASTRFTRDVVLEAGALAWEKQQSAFAAVRLWGGTVELAYGAQAAMAVFSAFGVAWLWRGRAAFAVKAAGLVCGALLATPYVLDYDMVIVAPAIAWMAAHGMKHGFLDWEKTVLALAWIAPLVARASALAINFPLGLIVLTALFLLILRRAWMDGPNFR